MRDEKKYRPLREGAMVLYVYDGCTQKEIAERLGVAQKTVSTWCQKYNWKKALESSRSGNSANSLYDFMIFLKEKYPSDFSKVESIYKSYLNSH